MASLPMSQQVQALQARVAELEQENRSLRLDLETCQRSQASPSQVTELERAYAMLQAQLRERDRCEQELQEQVDIAREQEKAAQERAAELAKANEVMRRTFNRLAIEPSLDSFLGFLLYEIATQLGADTAVITPYDSSSNHMWIAALFGDGKLETINPMTPSLPCSNALFLNRLLDVEGFCVFDVENDANLFWPGAVEFLRDRNKHHVISFAIRLDGQLFGQIGLAYETVPNFSLEQTALVQALSTQAALAIQLTRLAEEAKQAAIAREQEKAAQERAAELAKANATLRRSLSWLAHEGNLNQFLERVLLEIASTAQADLAYLFVLQEPERMLEVTARVINGAISDRPTPTEPAIFLAPFSADITPAFRYMEEQNLFLTLDMAMLEPEVTEMMWPDAIDWHLREGRKQVASLVLKAGDRSVGFLGLGFREAREFSQEERELVHALANQASLAILLIQLAEEAKQAAIAREQEKAAQERAAELMKANEALQRSLTMLANEPTLDKFLGYVLQVTAHSLGAIGAGLFRYDLETDTSYMLLTLEDGAMCVAAASQHPAGKRPITDTQNEHSYPLLIKRQIRIDSERDFATLPQYAPFREYLAQRGVKTLISVPLFLGDEFRGSITLRFDCERILTPEEEELAHALANQAVLAMELTRLADEAKQEAQQTAILTERNRIAREIHDTLAQCLTGIIVQLQAAEDAQTTNPGDELIHILQATELAKAGLVEARRSVRALRPQALEDATTLDAALTQLAQHHSHNLSATCQVIGTPYFLPSHIEANLLRIAQEALTNCIRHAVASQVAIALNYQPEQVTLQIQDNGCGFDTNQPTREGYGLMGMRERAAEIGATLTLTSQPGTGTEVAIVLPLSPEG